jgi:enoyl-[acyl-carrier protein] reductase II
VIKNRLTAAWEGREAEIEPFPLQMAKISKEVGENVYEAARLHGETDKGPCASGQSCALIHEVKGVAEIVDDVVSEADAILSRFSQVPQSAGAAK